MKRWLSTLALRVAAVVLGLLAPALGALLLG